MKDIPKVPTNANVDRLVNLMLDAPSCSYKEAIAKVGLSSMCRMYDIARLRKYFIDANRRDILESGEFWGSAISRKAHVLALEGQSIACLSHLDSPDPRYIWTNEFLGFAPEGHPAKGQVIFARIDNVDMTKEVPDMLFGGLGVKHSGVIVPSSTEYVCIHIKDYSCRYNQIDFGYILDFEEKKGLLVPIMDGRRTSFNYDAGKDVKGYGTIFCTLDQAVPLCCRPASWAPGIVFNNNINCENKFKVIRKQQLERIIGST